jgi:hypothetical protein
VRLLFTHNLNRKGEPKMKSFKTYLIFVAALAGLVVAGAMLAPHTASGANPNTQSVQFVPSAPLGVTATGGFGLPTSFTVPAKQHLIIETVSIQLDVTPSGSQVGAFVNYTSGGNAVTLFVPLSFAYTTPSNSFDTYHASEAVRLYADPGTSVSLTTFTPSGSVGSTFLTLSGYLD